MASPAVTQRGETSMVSREKELLGQGPPATSITRPDTASTTGSGMRMPLGHWTLPISGNCPGCKHHHKSVEIHVKDINDTSELVDLHCEKCNKLWLGPGNKNSTRLSLVSNATLDPPPMEPEVRKTLAHMIQSTTRVATLSLLPDIQEGVQLKSSEPALDTVAAQRTPDRIVKPSTKDAKSTQSARFILRLNQSLTRTFPILRTTRLGRRLMKLHDNSDTSTMACRAQSSREPCSASFNAMSQPQGVQTTVKVVPHQEHCEALSKEIDVCGPPANATQGLNSRMIVDQDDIDDIRHEGGQSHHFESFATLEAIRNSLLAGIGAFDTTGGGNDYCDSSPATNRPLSISGTNMSDSLTAVESTAYAPRPYLNATLHRQPRQAGPARRSSAQSDLHAWQQSRQDPGDVRLSLDLGGTIDARVGVSIGTPTLHNTGASSSQSRSRTSRGNNITQTKDNDSSASLPPLPQHAYREWD